MKILIICHEFPPLGGGAANAAIHLAKHMKDLGHDITVLTSRFKKISTKSHNFTVSYISVLRRHIDRTSPIELLSFALSGIINGLFKHKKNKYDICLAIHGIPSGWVAIFLYILYGTPYVVSLQGGDVPGFLPESYDKLHGKIKFLTNLYWKNAKLITANSLGLKKLAETTSKKIKKEVIIIPNGVECHTFKPKYSLRSNKTIKIIFTGRITLQKGLKCLVETIKHSINQIKNKFILEIIGEGNLKKNIQTISDELSNKGIIHFSDWQNKKNLIKKYQESHIFILPSLYEGMSNSLLEAMACGCMVIATDIAGSNELVKNEKNGFLFKPNDSVKLKNILIKVLNSENKIIESMGRKSRAIAKQYDWSRVADTYLNDFDKIISEQKIE